MKAAVRKVASATTLVFAAALAGCSTIEYNQDFDPQIDFSKYKTYMWMQVADPAQQHPTGVNELLEKRFIAAIDENLTAKGCTKTETPPTDFVVNFVATTQNKVDFNTYYTGWGYYGWYGGTQVEAYSYTEGTLIIDIFDAATKAMAWRGTATATINPSASPEQRNVRIQEAVAGIFQKFPPGPPAK